MEELSQRAPLPPVEPALFDSDTGSHSLSDWCIEAALESGVDRGNAGTGAGMPHQDGVAERRGQPRAEWLRAALLRCGVFQVLDPPRLDGLLRACSLVR